MSRRLRVYPLWTLTFCRLKPALAQTLRRILGKLPDDGGSFVGGDTCWPFLEICRRRTMETRLAAETVTFNERQIKAANDDCEEVECSYRTHGDTRVHNRVNKRAVFNSLALFLMLRKLRIPLGSFNSIPTQTNKIKHPGSRELPNLLNALFFVRFKTSIQATEISLIK